VVVWANDKAKADSARGGTPNLVGMNLFRDFHQEKPNVWKGKAFVPDLNRTFTGTITIEKEDTAVARGCLIGNVGCKSQIWTRVRSTPTPLAFGQKGHRKERDRDPQAG
jgi:uncharacterized protein (DUF2147 family)